MPFTSVVVEAAISDPRRPDDQLKLDVARKPALSVLFSGAKPGDRIADVMSGNGYFTRILSDVVGPSGHVYAYIPTEQIAHCSPREIAGTQAIVRDSSYRNVTLLTGSLANFRVPEKLDLIWMSQSYHDLHDSFLGPASVAIIDKTIDPLRMKSEIEAAGFVLESQSDALRNTDDDHKRAIFDPNIRGKTDQVLFRFRKPQ